MKVLSDVSVREVMQDLGPKLEQSDGWKQHGRAIGLDLSSFSRVTRRRWDSSAKTRTIRTRELSLVTVAVYLTERSAIPSDARSSSKSEVFVVATVAP